MIPIDNTNNTVMEKKVSFFNDSIRNLGLPVVAARLTNLILRKRLLIHSIFSKSIHLRCSSLLCSIKAFAVVMITGRSFNADLYLAQKALALLSPNFLEFLYCFCWTIHRCVFPVKKTFFVGKKIIAAFPFYR